MAGGKLRRKGTTKKKQGPARKKQTAKAEKKPAPSKKKGEGKSRPSGQGVPTPATMKTVVDASLATHIPPPVPLGPYTVLRGRATINISSSALGQQTVLLLGPHTVATIGSRDLTITPNLGVSGVGTNVPGTTETLYSDAMIGPYAASLAGNLANGNLHGLTMVLNCLSTATQAEGQVYVGSLNQRINRSRFPTWNDVANSLVNRREVQPHSAYNILSTPLKVSCYPVDIVDWARQMPVVLQSGTTGENVTMDSLSQMVLVIPATTAVVNYTLTVYTEWRVNFVDAALSSTAVSRPASRMDLWSQIAHVGNETSGFISRAESALAGGMKAFGALRGGMSTLARAGMVLGL